MEHPLVLQLVGLLGLGGTHGVEVPAHILRDLLLSGLVGDALDAGVLLGEVLQVRGVTVAEDAHHPDVHRRRLQAQLPTVSGALGVASEGVEEVGQLLAQSVGWHIAEVLEHRVETGNHHFHPVTLAVLVLSLDTGQAVLVSKVVDDVVNPLLVDGLFQQASNALHPLKHLHILLRATEGDVHTGCQLSTEFILAHPRQVLAHRLKRGLLVGAGLGNLLLKCVVPRLLEPLDSGEGHLVRHADEDRQHVVVPVGRLQQFRDGATEDLQHIVVHRLIGSRTGGRVVARQVLEVRRKRGGDALVVVTHSLACDAGLGGQRLVGLAFSVQFRGRTGQGFLRPAQRVIEDVVTTLHEHHIALHERLFHGLAEGTSGDEASAAHDLRHVTVLRVQELIEAHLHRVRHRLVPRHRRGSGFLAADCEFQFLGELIHRETAGNLPRTAGVGLVQTLVGVAVDELVLGEEPIVDFLAQVSEGVVPHITCNVTDTDTLTSKRLGLGSVEHMHGVAGVGVEHPTLLGVAHPKFNAIRGVVGALQHPEQLLPLGGFLQTLNEVDAHPLRNLAVVHLALPLVDVVEPWASDARLGLGELRRHNLVPRTVEARALSDPDAHVGVALRHEGSGGACANLHVVGSDAAEDGVEADVLLGPAVSGLDATEDGEERTLGEFHREEHRAKCEPQLGVHILGNLGEDVVAQRGSASPRLRSRGEARRQAHHREFAFEGPEGELQPRSLTVAVLDVLGHTHLRVVRDGVQFVSTPRTHTLVALDGLGLHRLEERVSLTLR